MPLSSMTGFSRSEGETPKASWVWEIKSVNGKGLDMRFRLPGGFDRIEPQVREAIQKRFRRGNFSINLAMNARDSEGGYRINWDVLSTFVDAMPELSKRCTDVTPPSADGLLGLRGVIEAADEELDEEDKAALDKALMDTMTGALNGLEQARNAEGERLLGFLREQVSTIRNLHGAATTETARQADILRDRVKNSVADLLAETPALPEERIAQEVAILLTKADVSEELDRLSAHCDAANDLLNADGSIGRKFDFLCQEFNREANTLCSKAVVPELTTIGLELKVVIDQMREQVQNVE